MLTMRRWLICSICALPTLAFSAESARAGTYVVNACSYFGNPGLVFSSTTNGVNWSPANECNVGRTLELNNSGSGDGTYAGWVADSPSAALSIVHA